LVGFWAGVGAVDGVLLAEKIGRPAITAFLLTGETGKNGVWLQRVDKFMTFATTKLPPSKVC